MRLLHSSAKCLFRQACIRYNSSTTKPTCLTDLHAKHGAKFAPFAGYKMPTVYDGFSISDSTIHTRKHASIFDVSHMLQTTIHGKHSHAFMESLTTINLKALKNGRGSLTVFTNDNGGIQDDLIVSKVDENNLYVVTNAGCIDNDVKIMQSALAKWKSEGKDVNLTHMHGHGLVAFQGPEAVKVMQTGMDIDLSLFYFMQTTVTELFGIPDCRITRCGYTGEDGFEISVQPDRAVELCETLLQSKESDVKWAGLGARDALRLEAGLCLYGKRRRELGDFPGAHVVKEQLADKSKLSRFRVGFTAKEGGRPPRGHAEIVNDSDQKVGEVTSGCPSPCLGFNIGQAYVKPQFAQPGTKLTAKIGKSRTPIEIAKMPFVKTGYYSEPKKAKK